MQFRAVTLNYIRVRFICLGDSSPRRTMAGMHLGKVDPLFRGLQTTDQHPGVDIQPGCDLQDVMQRHVPPPSLDLAEVRPVQPASLGSLLLTESQLRPPGQHPTTELTRSRRDGRFGRGGHIINPIGPMTINPETMNPMFMNPGIVGEPKPVSGSATRTDQFGGEVTMIGGGDFKIA